MKGIRKILVAIDGSDNSKRAVDFALGLAGPTKAQVTLLQAREFLDGQLAFYGGYAKGEQAGPPDAFNVTELYPTLNDTTVNWQSKDTVGHPADIICEEAKNGKYDLVVVGSKGASAISRFFLGSVSDRVVHHAETNVLVVR